MNLPGGKQKDLLSFEGSVGKCHFSQCSLKK